MDSWLLCLDLFYFNLVTGEISLMTYVGVLHPFLHYNTFIFHSFEQ